MGQYIIIEQIVIDPSLAIATPIARKKRRDLPNSKPCLVFNHDS